MRARSFSLLRQLAWAATLATGFGTVWFLLVLWLGMSLPDARQAGNRPPYESLVVRSDGTILIQSIPPDNLSLTTFRDLQGQVQDAPDRSNQLTGASMAGEPRNAGFLSSELGWHARLKFFANELEPMVNWFFVHGSKPDGAGYFVAYERKSNRRIGFVGLSGFRADPVPRDDWIPASAELKSSAPVYIRSVGGWVLRPEGGEVPPRLVYVPSGNHLRKVDLAARTIATILETREPIVEPGVPTLASWSGGHPSQEQHILVRTTQHVHELDQNDRVIRVFTMPAAIDRQSTLEWYQLEGGKAMAVVTPPASAQEPEKLSKRIVLRIASDGTIQDRLELDLQTGATPQSKQTQALEIALAAPAPAILLVANLVKVLWIDPFESYPAALTVMLKEFGASLIAVLALSIVLAVMAWRRSRAFGLSNREQIAWAAFTLLFGLPAYVGFLLYRSWPTRQPCPNCHARAPRDRETCAECGTLFPHPAPKGVEIFA